MGELMSALQIQSGANQGETITLEQERVILGRNPECGIVIPVTSVSREHAQIVRVQGRFYIEDMKSRNGTFVNNQQIAARTQLKNNDKIRICDFQATFVEPPARPTTDDDEDEAPDASSSSTVEATLSHASGLQLEAQPADKLRGLLEITANLSKTLELDRLLPKIVDSLFTLFRQADRGFIILSEDDNKKLLPKVVKTRRAIDEGNARFSRGIVKKCLEEAQAFLSDDATQDNRVQLSQSVVDFRIRSVMCVPLSTTEGTPFGVIQLDTQDRTKKFTKGDLELLMGVATQASIALENARLYVEAVAKERINRDLELARTIQRSFLPEKFPEVPGYEFHALYESAYQVGGDYYDFVPLRDRNKLGIALGDVAGKGVAAALLMAKVSSDARFCFLTEPALDKVITHLNALMAPQCGRLDRFVTCAAVELDPKTHIATLCNAGHISPLHYRHAAKTWTQCVPRRTSGLPLGMMDDTVYDSCQVTLEPGDTILMYSDGITDIKNSKGEEFGQNMVVAALKEANTHSPRGQIEKLVRAVKQFSAGVEQQFDDMSLVGLGRTL